MKKSWLTKLFSLALSVFVCGLVVAQLSACSSNGKSKQELLADAHAAAEKQLSGLVYFKDPQLRKNAVHGMTEALKESPTAHNFDPKVGEAYMAKLFSHNSFKLDKASEGKLDTSENPKTASFHASFELLSGKQSTAALIKNSFKDAPPNELALYERDLSKVFQQLTGHIDEAFKKGELIPRKFDMTINLTLTKDGWQINKGELLKLTQQLQ